MSADPPSAIELNELEIDSLSEVINIGMSHAATALGGMINERVSLDVPEVRFLSCVDVVDQLNNLSGGSVSAVCQRFDGSIGGDALLLFPQDKSLDLVRLLLSSEMSLEMLTQLEQEALTEVGNIILNACFGKIANALNITMESTLPSYLMGSCEEIIGNLAEDTRVLFMRVNFCVPNHDINGFVTFVMDIESTEILHGLISHLAERYQ